MDTTAIQEYERIKSSEIEVSEGMDSVDIKRNRFSRKFPKEVPQRKQRWSYYEKRSGNKPGKAKKEAEISGNRDRKRGKGIANCKKGDASRSGTRGIPE